jgi:molybdopterin converting factor small subunit
MNDNVTVRCLFFGESKSITGIGEKSFTLPINSTTQHLEKILLEEYPKLQKILPQSIFSVNLEYIEKSQSVILKQNDEVAVIPPLSGG